MTALIEFENASFEYPNGFRAVEGLTLAIEAGEAVAIVGQNGAGKTTTAKMMNGLFKPSSGAVHVLGEDTRGKTTAQISRHVGYVFQNPDDQIFHNDVYSEIEFGPKRQGLEGTELEDRVYEAAVLSGIAQFLDENPYNLPYSTRKFVAIASTLAMDCDAVILDEPTAGQDLRGMQTIGKIVSRLQEQGKAIVTITHDMQFVVDNFERVVAMAHKQIIAQGGRREIFWRHDVLEDAALKQPYLSELAHGLGYTGEILDVVEFVDEYERRAG